MLPLQTIACGIQWVPVVMFTTIHWCGDPQPSACVPVDSIILAHTCVLCKYVCKLCVCVCVVYVWCVCVCNTYFIDGKENESVCRIIQWVGINGHKEFTI